MNIIQAILNLFFGGNKKKEVKELDKQIAEAVIDDNEVIKTINDEIDNTRTVRGQFTTTEIEGQTPDGEEEEES